MLLLNKITLALDLTGFKMIKLQILAFILTMYMNSFVIDKNIILK